MSPLFALCVHPIVGGEGDDQEASYDDLTYHQTQGDAERAADAHSENDCDVYPVELAETCRGIKGATCKTSLRLLGRSDRRTAPENVSFYPSEEAAIGAVAFLLVGEEYHLNRAICRYGSPDERGLLLGADNKLKDVHYTDEPLLRYLIKYFLVGVKLDFQINVVGPARISSIKRQRV
jgi:hypothetical protein